MSRLGAEQLERYKRHLLLAGVGPAGEEKLLRSSALVIGAGGLGSPALLYLAAAGVGRIGLVDFDRVDLSNLQRQVLYTSQDVGALKTDVAAQRLHALNPDVQVTVHEARLDASNAQQIFAGYDVVLDGTDTFPSRYLAGDVCVWQGKPLVSGSVMRFEGRDLLKLPAAEWRTLRGRRIAMIFQEPMTALNPVIRIGDQIMEAFEAHGHLALAERRARTRALAEEVGLRDLERIINSYPHQLSGGQRQRAMIAMALALEPSILVADEPTTALDVTTQAQILRLIRDIQQRRGMAVLFITHDFGVVADIADRVAVMEKGRVVEQGSVADVLERPQHPYTRRLLAAVPGLTPPVRPAVGAAPVACAATGLAKTYRGNDWFGAQREVAAVKSVNFEIRRGETLGLVGESGSGKSTIGRLVMRLTDADAGVVRVGEVDFTQDRGAGLRVARKHIQMVFQDPFTSLNPRRRVGRIIADGPIAHGVPAAQAFARADELLTLVGLDPGAAQRFPHEFSGVQRQRIGIARALALDPEVIVAAEPLSAPHCSVPAQRPAVVET
jgi:peptide/nickel transport system ATP-binding protein